MPVWRSFGCQEPSPTAELEFRTRRDGEITPWRSFGDEEIEHKENLSEIISESHLGRNDTFVFP